jgi:hypothetical protein
LCTQILRDFWIQRKGEKGGTKLFSDCDTGRDNGRETENSDREAERQKDRYKITSIKSVKRYFRGEFDLCIKTFFDSIENHDN